MTDAAQDWLAKWTVRVFILCLVVLPFVVYSWGYTDGQNDALDGQIELVENK